MTEPGPMGPWTLQGPRRRISWVGASARSRVSRLLPRAVTRRRPAWPSELRRRRRDQRLDPGAKRRAGPSRDVLDDVDRSYERLADAIAALPEDIVTSPDALPWMEGESLAETRPLRSPLRRAHAVDPRMARHARLTERAGDRVYDAVHDRDRRRDADLPPLHRRGVVRFHLGRDVREPQPGRHARRRRALPAGDQGRRRRWPSRRPRRPTRCGRGRRRPSAARSCTPSAP